MSSVSKVKAPEPYRGALRLIIVLAAMGLLASPIILISSIMMFDAPGSIDMPITRYFAGGLLSIPLVAIACLISATLSLRRFSKRAFVVPVTFAVGWVIYMVIVNLVLNSVCDGEFDCQKAKPSTTAPVEKPSGL